MGVDSCVMRYDAYVSAPFVFLHMPADSAHSNIQCGQCKDIVKVNPFLD